MTKQNINKKEKKQPETIQNQLETLSANKIDLEYIPFLYGMSLDEYKEGLEIHSKCFNQMKKIRRIVN